MGELFRYFLTLVVLVLLPSAKISYFVLVPYPDPLPDRIRPGESLVLPKNDQVQGLLFQGRPLTVLREQKLLLAWASIHDGSSVQLTGYLSPDTPSSWSWLHGQPQKFFSDSIPVAEFNLTRAPALNLSKDVWNKVSEQHAKKGGQERELIQQILANGSPSLLDEGCFKLPLDSTVLSGFGAPRTLPNGRKYHHSGLDLRARSPLKLPPMGAGKVVFAGHMSVPGNMVIVDHGGYLHSRYMHLSEISVEEGEDVTSESLLGKTGRTGRITGPHLHWEVLWHGRAVDPMGVLQTWAKLKSCAIEGERALSSYVEVARELESQLYDSSQTE